MYGLECSTAGTGILKLCFVSLIDDQESLNYFAFLKRCDMKRAMLVLLKRKEMH